GINEGKAANSVSPESRISNTGSRSSERASVRRRRCDQRGDRPAGTEPTCDERRVRRREWKAPPSASGTVRVPYQLISSTVASKPAIASAVARPSGVPLAWMTRSASGRAVRGAAKRQDRKSVVEGKSEE